MGKKDRKPPVVNNIQELNLDIDYDKLAEAIELARKVNNKADNKKDEASKVGFWKKVYYVIVNKSNDSTVSLTAALSSLMSLFFNMIALLLFLFGVLCLAMIFVVISQKSNYHYLIFYMLLAVLMLMLALIMRGIANEIGREKDKNYIIATFSGIVSFVALIVALVALFKGVG